MNQNCPLWQVLMYAGIHSRVAFSLSHSSLARQNRRAVVTTLLWGSEDYHLVAGSFPQPYTHFTASLLQNKGLIWCHQKKKKIMGGNGNTLKTYLGSPAYYTVETMGPSQTKMAPRNMLGEGKAESQVVARRELGDLARSANLIVRNPEEDVGVGNNCCTCFSHCGHIE